jgi:UDPglucose--hexose-1-phosphate uridylyltransferase
VKGEFAELNQHPHRRFDPLRREWVLVSPHRTARPWNGQIEPSVVERLPPYDSTCYLCPGNERAGGHRNPAYASTFVFDNDFAALQPSTPAVEHRDPLFTAQTERGVCRVVCFTPRHDLTLARMNAPDIRLVIDAWSREYASLASLPSIGYVLVFENRGAMMGTSNPHPHGQIWATETIPNEAARELASLQAYRTEHGTCLFCDYLAAEIRAAERIVCENEAFAALVPFWAVWPFEALVIARRHVAVMDELSEPERDGLADILKRLTVRYDGLFETPCPYSMGFHQRPARRAGTDVSHLHAHFYPPLLRSASIRKFMVGFEMLGSPQRDVTPEEGAARLREVGEVYYTNGIDDC